MRSVVHRSLTLPSRGRAQAGFACLRPPLMSNVRALSMHLRVLLLCCTLLIGGCASVEVLDPLVGTFHLDAEPRENTHKFWKQDGKYFYAACFNGKCSAQPQEARVLDSAAVSEWFPPKPRSLEIGVRAITVDGSGIVLFFVERPDERIRQWTRLTTSFASGSSKGQRRRFNEAEP
jgi:hypothetical protein